MTETLTSIRRKCQTKYQWILECSPGQSVTLVKTSLRESIDSLDPTGKSAKGNFRNITRIVRECGVAGTAGLVLPFWSARQVKPNRPQRTNSTDEAQSSQSFLGIVPSVWNGLSGRPLATDRDCFRFEVVARDVYPGNSRLTWCAQKPYCTRISQIEFCFVD